MEKTERKFPYRSVARREETRGKRDPSCAVVSSRKSGDSSRSGFMDGGGQALLAKKNSLSKFRILFWSTPPADKRQGQKFLRNPLHPIGKSWLRACSYIIHKGTKNAFITYRTNQKLYKSHINKKVFEPWFLVRILHVNKEDPLLPIPEHPRTDRDLRKLPKVFQLNLVADDK